MFIGAIGCQPQHSVNAVKVVEARFVVAVAPNFDATGRFDVVEVNLGYLNVQTY